MEEIFLKTSLVAFNQFFGANEKCELEMPVSTIKKWFLRINMFISNIFKLEINKYIILSSFLTFLSVSSQKNIFFYKVEVGKQILFCK